MNNTIKFASAFIAALCIVSCNEKIETDLVDTPNYITVSSEVDVQVKAGYEGTSALPEKFIIDIDQTGNSPDYNKTMVRSGSSNQYVFNNNENLVWAGKDQSGVAVRAMTFPSGATDVNGNVTVKVQNNQTTDPNVQASDLLGAQTGNGVDIRNSHINIRFNHLLSKLYVSYNKSDSYTVTSISVGNICVQGTYSYNNMASVSAVAPSNNTTISMFHDASSNTAEAIFYPYTPASNPQLTVKYKRSSNGTEQTITCPISLGNITSFEGGKRYIMNIVISGSSIEGAEVTVVDWASDISSIQVRGEKVLWIGTSIAQGQATQNYPDMVDEAMNCTVKNKAVGGSLVLKEKNADWVLNTTKEAWETIAVTSYDDISYSFNHLRAGGLAQTHSQADMYKTNLNTVYMAETPDPGAEPTVSPKPDPRDYYWYGGANSTQYKNALAAYEAEVKAHNEWQVKYDARQAALATVDSWVNTQIDKIKSLSYMSLILPHINGSQGYEQYTTVILDHGFNDVSKMAFEAGGHYTAYEYQDWGDVWGYSYLMSVKSKVVDYDQYKSDFNGNSNLTAGGKENEVSYILAMSDVIQAIKAANSSVKIIIGNYFALNSPWVKANHFPTFNENFTSLICYNNEALAAMWDLDIVNVYEYLQIDEDMFWNPNGADYSKFCPDGVHPATYEAVSSIAEVYIRQLDGIIGSRN